MRKKQLIAVICVFILSGCTNREKLTKEEIKSQQEEFFQEEPTNIDNQNHVNKENEAVTIELETDENGEYILETDMTAEKTDYSAYVSDKHFYDSRDWIEFNYKSDAVKNPVSMKMKINSAQVLKTVDELPEYFQTSRQTKEMLENKKEYVTNSDGMEEEIEVESVYELINLSLCNLSEQNSEVCIGNFNLYKRIDDSTGEQLGLANKATVKISGECDYDYSDKSIGKKFYYFQLLAGETITTNICYRVAVTDLKEEIYLLNGATLLSTPNKDGITIPYESDSIKYLKVYLNEN